MRCWKAQRSSAPKVAQSRLHITMRKSYIDGISLQYMLMVHPMFGENVSNECDGNDNCRDIVCTGKRSDPSGAGSARNHEG